MDEFCAGVQIILKRIESNPEEFTKEPSPWKRLMDAVIASKFGDFDDRYYLRALTSQEIDALHKAFLPMLRQEFDTWVMKQVLVEPEETLRFKATERYATGWTDPRMLQNAVPPGTMITVAGSGGGGSAGITTNPARHFTKLETLLREKIEEFKHK